MQKSTNSDTSVETLNPTHQGTGPVQMRIKNANSHHDRLSQSKSMILTDVGKVTEPISRHRRNHSQHVLKDVIPPLEQLMVEKEGYLQKAKIADGGKKLRKNWSTSWIVLSSRKIEFYKESKQQAVSNMKAGNKPESVDLCGAHIEWAKEKSSRKNVFQLLPGSGMCQVSIRGTKEVTELTEHRSLILLHAGPLQGEAPMNGGQEHSVPQSPHNWISKCPDTTFSI